MRGHLTGPSPLTRPRTPGRVRRRSRRRYGPELPGSPFLLPNLDEIFDVGEMLHLADHLSATHGQAAGVDRIRYTNLGRSELAPILRCVRRAIINDYYRPSPTRIHRIRKLSGGWRELHIPTIIDRIVQAALAEAMSPVWESIFSPRSYGFRPQRGTLQLLAHLEAEVIHYECPVLTIDDVRKAFDNIRIRDVTAAHARLLGVVAQPLLSCIETIIRGHDGPRRTIGIDQGSVYSPTALNVVMHIAHDMPLTQHEEHIHRLWWRYADNNAYATRTVSDGRHVLNTVQNLLSRVGLTLKGEDGGPKDLRDETVELLGFQIRLADDHLDLAIGSGAWENLDRSLSEAQMGIRPPATTRDAIWGWLNTYGPAIENMQRSVIDRIRMMARMHGFREMPDRTFMHECIRESINQWNHMRHRASLALQHRLSHSL